MDPSEKIAAVEKHLLANPTFRLVHEMDDVSASNCLSFVAGWFLRVENPTDARGEFERAVQAFVQLHITKN
jgi:hypothetical protein